METMLMDLRILRSIQVRLVRELMTHTVLSQVQLPSRLESRPKRAAAHKANDFIRAVITDNTD